MAEEAIATDSQLRNGALAAFATLISLSLLPHDSFERLYACFDKLRCQELRYRHTDYLHKIRNTS